MKHKLSKNINGCFQAGLILLVFLIVLFTFQIISIEVERMISISIIESDMPTFYSPPKRSIIESADKEVTPEGIIHLVHKEYMDETCERRAKVYDANMNLLWQGDDENIPYTYVTSSFYHSGRISSGFMPDEPWVPIEFGDCDDIGVYRDGMAVEKWRLLSNKNIFEGFNRQRQRIGYISASGFSEQKQQAKPFGKITSYYQNGPGDIYYLMTDYTAYAVNFIHHTSEEIFRSDSVKIKRIGYASDENRPDDKVKYRSYRHVLTADGVLRLYISLPQENVVIKLPENWEDLVINMALTQERILLWTLEKIQAEDANNTVFSSQVVYKVTSSGDLNELDSLRWETTWPDIYAYDFYETASPVSVIMKSFSPVLYSLSSDKMLKNTDPSISSERLWFIAIAIMNEFRTVNIWYCFLVSLICVAIVLLHAWPRRTSRAKLIAWLVFVGLFNLAGLLTYLGLEHHPVIKCKNCGRKRNLETPNCVHCGAGLPKPQLREVDKVLITQR